MLLDFLCPIAFGVLLVSATASPTKTRRQNVVSNDKFVSTAGSQFTFNGSEFRFVGTNAYWLAALNTEEDIIATFTNITAAGINVVRTWAFNDVDTIPDDNSTWFQLISNGTTTINNGTNGLAKLDAVIRQAENFGIFLILTLTNNWNPRPLFDNLTASIENLTSTVESSLLFGRDVTPGTNNSLPRNTLSNDYGGMDVYVRQFGATSHDDFYTNEAIITTFENYTNQVVSRYVDSPAVFSWEIANDPRCNSSVSASATCSTTTITSWVSRLSAHIQSVDGNHLITSGNQGFFCDTSNCQKLFPKTAPPQVSPAPVSRRGVRAAPFLTRAKIAKEKKERRKKRVAETRSSNPPANAVKIRGKWAAPPTKRQSVAPVASLNDGSQGVDSEDIINIPQVGFGTFQLFPDQNTYGPEDPNLPVFNNTVENGIDWIKQQAAVSQLFGKPIILTGFGLVTQANAPFFVPFNTSIAPFGLGTQSSNSSNVQPFGVTDQQRDDAYTQWLDAGIAAGIQGMLQYQWGLSNLTALNSTASIIQPEVNSTSESPNQQETGQSPNDGYSIQGVGQEAVQGVVQQGVQNISSTSA